MVVYVHGLWLSGGEAGLAAPAAGAGARGRDPCVFLSVGGSRCSATNARALAKYLATIARGHAALGRAQPGRLGDPEAVRERAGPGSAPARRCRRGASCCSGSPRARQPRGPAAWRGCLRQENHGADGVARSCWSRASAAGAARAIWASSRAIWAFGLGRLVGRSGHRATAPSWWRRRGSTGAPEHLVLRVSHTRHAVLGGGGAADGSLLADGRFGMPSWAVSRSRPRSNCCSRNNKSSASRGLKAFGSTRAQGLERGRFRRRGRWRRGHEQRQLGLRRGGGSQRVALALELRQIAARLCRDGFRDAGERRDLQSIALVGRALLDAVQEHQACRRVRPLRHAR